jgi:ATP-binding protein involved in chromosome partitioning
MKVRLAACPAKRMNIDPSAVPPQSVLRDHQAKRLRIAWHDGLEVAVPYRVVRAACGCARCVDEATGQRLVFLDDIDPNVIAEELQAVGAYAIRILWSDGHNTGLYTWPQLRALSEDAASPTGDD